MPKKLDSEVQGRAISEVMEYRNESENLSKSQRERLFRIYQGYRTYRDNAYGYVTTQSQNMRTDFKVNKAHEIVEKVLVRIIGKDPKFIVTPRDISSFANDGEQVFVDQETKDGGIQRDFSTELKDRSAEFSAVVQDYLAYLFDEYNLRAPLKHLAKNLIVYGKAYAKPVWKYEVARISKLVSDEQGAEELAEEGAGEEVEIKPTQNEVVEEKVIGQYPWLEVISWTDMYYDPRYIFLEDRPAMVEVVEGVRYSQLMKDKNDYINLDKLKEMLSVDTTLDPQQYKNRIRQISGIMNIDPKVLKDGSLKVTKYYGYFSPTEDVEDEKMYEICTVNDMLVIKMKEITSQPIQEVKCFDDPETAYATGFVEPILGLQEEMNWKKNSASEYINQMITRRFIWSQQSGIDPKDMMNPIIPTSKSGQEALANIPELQLSEIPSSYFQEENDFERQIQAMSFTVDTSNPRSENALTNTATGARIKFFESNSVLDEVRKTFEKFLERLAYALLMMTFENMDKNMVFKKQGTEEYWNVNKEFLRNAIQRYSIKTEANSSSFDSIESRREDAIAFLNGLTLIKNNGGNVNLDPALEEWVETFEKRDPRKYINPPSMQQVMGEVGVGGPGQALAQPNTPQNPAAKLTEEVAQGKITSLIPR